MLRRILAGTHSSWTSPLIASTWPTSDPLPRTIPSSKPKGHASCGHKASVEDCLRWFARFLAVNRVTRTECPIGLNPLLTRLCLTSILFRGSAIGSTPAFGGGAWHLKQITYKKTKQFVC